MAVLFAAPAVGLAAYLLATLVRGSHDYREYEIYWQAAQNVSFPSMLSTYRLEPGSMFVYWWLAQYLTAGATFLVVSMSAFAAKSYLIATRLDHPWLAWFLYIALFMYLHDATQIRAGVAACFILYALMEAKTKTAYVLLALAAALFHYSGLIILVLWFVPRPLVGLGGVAAIALAWNVILMTLQVKLDALSGDAGQVSLTNSTFYAEAIICAVCALQWSRLSLEQKKGAYLMTVGVVCYLFFYRNPLLAHRLRELSVLGVLPVLFMGPRRSRDATAIIAAFALYLAGYSVWHVAVRFQDSSVVAGMVQ